MKILAIETSCDETAIAVLDCTSSETSKHFHILGNALLSQIDIHKEYGGVYPAIAKREHAKNLVPILNASLEEAQLLGESTQSIDDTLRENLAMLLAREPGLFDALLAFLQNTETPAIDAIAVTNGPGLEPALWVGVNFAKALALAWNKPLVGVNHMEGHLLAGLATIKDGAIKIENVQLPVLALLISGGHTELVVMREWLVYELLGATRDDAVGEAFDKVARMMDLPYPGGPEVSKLAEKNRLDTSSDFPRSNLGKLPRPMLDSDDLDFSFSGLKTAVLYLLKEKGTLTTAEKEELAEEFEDAVSDVLWAKTARAIEASGAKTVVMGGGVSANLHIQRVFREKMTEQYPGVELRIPEKEFTTDNAVMIAIAGYYRTLAKNFTDSESLKANGTLSIA